MGTWTFTPRDGHPAQPQGRPIPDAMSRTGRRDEVSEGRAFRAGARPDGRSGAPERALVRRVALVIAAQTAAAVTVILLLVGITVYVVEARTLHRATERAVRTAAQGTSSVEDAPPGVVLLRLGAGGGRSASPGAPREFGSLDLAALPLGLAERDVGTRRYEIFTVSAGGTRLSAALDMRRRSEETDRLLGALTFAGLVGVAGAATVGAAVGRRAVRPAVLALSLQRRFVADASHELRTPLTVVHTRAQLLRARLRGLHPDLAAETDQLVADTRALGEVVEDLLLSAELTARPAAGTVVDFGALVQSVVASLHAIADQRGISLVADIPDVPVNVRGVPAALRRALGSLVDNALGHVADGGHIRVRAERIGALVRLTVADDGEGLDPAHVQDLLSRFARGSASGEGRRFGLGLALVQEVVTAHRGRLELTGAPGRGATVTVELPAAG